MTLQMNDTHRKAPRYPYDFIDHVIITQEEIESRVNALGEQITRDYAELG